MSGKTKYIVIILLLLAMVSFGLYFIVGGSNEEFTVTFDSNGGTPVVKKNVKKGEKVSKPDDPTKDKNEFVEWQLNGVTYNFDSPISKNITLKAVWVELNAYSVKITLEDKEYTTNIMENGYLIIETLNIPEKEGYLIKIYDSNNEEYKLNTPINSDMVLTAKYVKARTFTVKFDSQGGTKVPDSSVIEGDIVSEPEVTKDGYTLDGWYLNNKKFDFGTSITSDITLQAKWIEK